jgi:diguanylate cyclase (GGDEF)-like protein/PAS domain S-box-containing protein
MQNNELDALKAELEKTKAELKTFLSVIEGSINIIFITDLNGTIEYVNSMFETVTGYTKAEATGKNPRILASGETPQAVYREMWDAIKSGRTWRGVLKNKKKNGGHYWVSGFVSPMRSDAGEITRFLAIQEDITSKVESEEKIHYLATHDRITAMINYTSFAELMDEWLSFAGMDNRTASLLKVNIDNFRFINNTYGNKIGSEFLRQVAGLIRSTCGYAEGARRTGKDCIAGHLGRDEFAVLLPDMNEQAGIMIAEKLRKKIEDFRFPDIGIRATASIGIAVYPAHGNNAEDLLTKADAALYRARMLGHNRCHVFRTEDQDLEDIHAHLKEKEHILKALEEDRFEIWFQPILDLSDNAVHHYEALVRLREEDGTILPPSEFIGTAEKFGLITAIDKVVAAKTITLHAEMDRIGRFLFFSINLSGKDLGDEDLLSFIRSEIKDSGIDPGRLIFEITETAAILDFQRAIRFIRALKEMGCRFSLDDFGVGFTSFVYLREMQLDYLKIDGFFVQKLCESTTDRFFVQAMIDVAKGLGIKTIAEFVDREETLEALRELGVDYAQGYLIGKPAQQLKDIRIYERH